MNDGQIADGRGGDPRPEIRQKERILMIASEVLPRTLTERILDAATLVPEATPIGCVLPPTAPVSARPQSAPKLSRMPRACMSA